MRWTSAWTSLIYHYIGGTHGAMTPRFSIIPTTTMDSNTTNNGQSEALLATTKSNKGAPQPVYLLVVAIILLFFIFFLKVINIVFKILDLFHLAALILEDISLSLCVLRLVLFPLLLLVSMRLTPRPQQVSLPQTQPRHLTYRSPP